ncbi:hypothetical protein CTAM01_05069 [Colletotrichum tamarilloi]|uniref:Uncharacterized protein n=1 Tax=Colletotrichum tamarilloi TaxID=1209934 RepID=A0ABQ9RG97_9PEZI|nr:uncharacterized protein CTAM01_05069 [Colletotrichum tamarilloi]KAK1503080.1 hypothetical protein CTAM01_05069 [Colletotrichum tamarilloi]
MGRPSLLYKGALAWDMNQEKTAAHQKRDALFDAKLRVECDRPGPFYKFAVKTFDDGVITSQAILRRFARSPDLTPESTDMGFGQIVALLLLVQPLMAVGKVRTGNQAEEVPVEIEVSYYQCQMSGDDVESRSSPAQPCSYGTHFDEMKRYFYTTINDPNLLPKDRQEHI